MKDKVKSLPAKPARSLQLQVTRAPVGKVGNFAPKYLFRKNIFLVFAKTFAYHRSHTQLSRRRLIPPYVPTPDDHPATSRRRCAARLPRLASRQWRSGSILIEVTWLRCCVVFYGLAGTVNVRRFSFMCAACVRARYKIPAIELRGDQCGGPRPPFAGRRFSGPRVRFQLSIDLPVTRLWNGVPPHGAAEFPLRSGATPTLCQRPREHFTRELRELWGHRRWFEPDSGGRDSLCSVTKTIFLTAKFIIFYPLRYVIA